VIAHDVAAQLSQITAPTQITFGRHDMLTSIRFADQMTGTIRGSELLIFEECAHAPIYQKVDEFNQKTLAFLQRQAVKGVRRSAAQSNQTTSKTEGCAERKDNAVFCRIDFRPLYLFAFLLVPPF
jgi:hypothetical protein